MIFFPGRQIVVVFTLAILMICTTTTPILAQIDPPLKANEYNKEFFEAHKKNELIYDYLVDIFSEFIIQEAMVTTQTKISLSDVSVMDVGCGHGLLVEAWRRAGITNSFCIEGSSEASHMWPLEHKEKFYVVQNLEAPEALVTMKATDFVTSFEVAEHLRPEKAEHFVLLLTMHHPKLIFFSAATPFQDRGINPSHVNENTFQYWIDRFASQDYHVDWVKTAFAKHQLVTHDDKKTVMTSWWYPKNLLIFSPKQARERNEKALLSHPKEAYMLRSEYLNFGFMSGDEQFGTMWKYNWQSFGELFYDAQSKLITQSKLVKYEL
eukprot:CAMPEP_0172492952 /NCGR_PEP_ID=MMETSP1066-20121228/24249_1 /TAXON_ID=671091 /ORGANISM="Coscinodiscus wailesii, Strain CCMP2513" /LENGTH=321 /DNA_ID=CAMNT_0013262853 /DNA_START=185 /DNA_END=1150 /DNA_ORIENTATION=-